MVASRKSQIFTKVQRIQLLGPQLISEPDVLTNHAMCFLIKTGSQEHFLLNTVQMMTFCVYLNIIMCCSLTSQELRVMNHDERMCI